MKTIYLVIGIVFSVFPLRYSYSQPVESTMSIDIPCFDTTEAIKSLKEHFKEILIFTGKTSDQAGSIMSVWVHPVGNSWTILATKKDLTCLIGIGTDFRSSIRNHYQILTHSENSSKQEKKFLDF